MYFPVRREEERRAAAGDDRRLRALSFYRAGLLTLPPHLKNSIDISDDVPSPLLQLRSIASDPGCGAEL